MAKIDELEEKLTIIERKIQDKVVAIDKVGETHLNFKSSSFFVDIEVDVASTKPTHIELELNGKTYVYDSNFVSERLLTKSVNELIIRVNMEGLLSKKIKIEGIGVRLLSA